MTSPISLAKKGDVYAATLTGTPGGFSTATHSDRSHEHLSPCQWRSNASVAHARRRHYRDCLR